MHITHYYHKRLFKITSLGILDLGAVNMTLQTLSQLSCRFYISVLIRSYKLTSSSNINDISSLTIFLPNCFMLWPSGCHLHLAKHTITAFSSIQWVFFLYFMHNVRHVTTTQVLKCCNFLNVCSNCIEVKRLSRVFRAQFLFLHTLIGQVWAMPPTPCPDRDFNWKHSPPPSEMKWYNYTDYLETVLFL